MGKQWSGRFKEETSDFVESFTESISFDKRLWYYDLMGSKAHAKMLAKTGIISKTDLTEILRGLDEISDEIEKGLFRFRRSMEDIHMNIEVALIEKIGDLGKKLHTARSRNDQIALDIRLFMRDEIKFLLRLLKKLTKVLLKRASSNIDTIMPGYTHLQRAQPVTMAHHLTAYVEMFLRDMERFEDCLKRTDSLPLGACALAGTTFATDRAYVAKLLGFQRISENSMDAVSDRDFIIEFISNASITMMHLSRLAEELVLWSSEEFSFIEISDSFTTGSSIMPQKKNPDVAELVRGKTGRVYGSLITVLTIMKALPLTYNRDMQEDKEPLFNALDTLKGSLTIFTEMLPKIRFNKKRMHKTAHSGFSLATDLAEYLVKKGTPFREAHKITGEIVKYCIDSRKELSDIDISEYNRFSPVIETDLYDYITIEKSLRNKKSRGSASPDEIKKQIERLKKIVIKGKS